MVQPLLQLDKLWSRASRASRSYSASYLGSCKLSSQRSTAYMKFRGIYACLSPNCEPQTLLITSTTLKLPNYHDLSYKRLPVSYVVLDSLSNLLVLNFT